MAIAMLAAAGGMLVFASATHAGDFNSGTVGGITYITDDSGVITPPGSGTPDALCPVGTEPTGGGGGMPSGGESDVFLNSVYPVDAGDEDRARDDGFENDFHRGSGVATSGNVYVMCSGRDARYSTAQKPVPAGRAGRARADCPRHTQVTGGGLLIDGTISDAWMNSSFPFDDDDANTKPDDGWKGRVYNAVAPRKQLTVVAICWPRERLDYVSASLTVGTGAAFSSSVACPSVEFVVGGGERLTGPASEIRVYHDFPGDLASDGDSAPDDVWHTGVTNSDTGSSKTLTKFVICRH